MSEKQAKKPVKKGKKPRRGTTGIYPHGDGKWRAFVRVGVYKRAPLTRVFDSHQDAVHWRSAMMVEARNQATPAALRIDRHTLGDAIDLYLEKQLPLLSVSTRKSRKQRLLWWRDALGHYAVRELRPAHFQDFFQDIISDKAPATKNRYLAAIRKVLNWVIKTQEWLTDNPAAKIASLYEDNKIERFLSEDEKTRLIEACRASAQPMLLPLVLLGIYLGGRKGELLNLRVDSFDFDRQVVVFYHDSSRGQRTKTKKSRAVPLHPDLLPVMVEYCRGKKPSSLVFPSYADPNKPFDPKRGWYTALKRAEIEGFRFHDLRHSFASSLLNLGASLGDIGPLMGHANVQTTHRYAHLADARGRDLISKLGGIASASTVSPPESPE